MTAAPDFAPLFQAERLPPANLEAEQSLLAAILANNSTFEQVADFLLAEHFADPAHGRIYDACRAMIDAGQTASAITLKNRFDQDEELAADGGARYLAGLQTSFVSLDAGHYGRIVYDCALRRGAMQIAAELSERAARFDYDERAETIIAETQQALDAMQDSKAAGGAETLSASIGETVEYIEAVQEGRVDPGHKTGIRALDELIGGLRPGGLFVLAGRPSMGKTAVGVSIARHVAQTAGPVIYNNLEMTTAETHMRLLAEETGIFYSHMGRPGRLGQSERSAIAAAAERLRSLPLHLDERPGLGVGQILAQARRIKRRNGLALLVVDHLGLVARPESRGSNDTAALGKICMALKSGAKQLGCPVLLLAQLSRGVEQREDKRPMMSDLRQSGEIEENADGVGLLYRERYYLERSEPQSREGESEDKFQERVRRWRERMEASDGVMEIGVGKWRHGEVGVARVGCSLGINRFWSLGE